MTSKSIVAALALLVATLVVAGCGGGSDDPFGLPDGGGGAAVTGPAYDPSTATATISGSVFLDGDAPPMGPVQMTADPYCVGARPNATSQEVLVTGDNKLQNVMVFLRSGYDDSLAYATPATPVVLDQDGCRYTPHVFTLMTDQTITFRNSDETAHNVHAFPMENMQINIGQPRVGMETMASFNISEGPFRIACDVHRWMVSYTAVFSHPFHTTTMDAGDYAISVPPGTYEVVTWHERYGEQVQEVTVAGGETAELNYTYVAE